MSARLRWMPLKLIFFLSALGLGFAAYRLPLAGLSQPGKIGLGIFVAAIFLWISEAVPLFITSFVILALEILLLGLPGAALHLPKGGYAIFLTPFFSPVILLFLGGFTIAAALEKYGLGEVMVATIINRVGRRPERVLLGVMAATAIISMWISTTAATAGMLAMLYPLIKQLPAGEKFRKALILGIPFASGVGGMSTPVGTPPNAIAIGALNNVGLELSFSRWILLALPLCLLQFYLLWRFLLWLFPPGVQEIDYRLPEQARLNGRQKAVVAVSLLTILLWITSDLHGIPSPAVSLFPVLALFGLRYLDQRDFTGLSWNILIIVGGGLSLGLAMEKTGVTAWLLTLLKVSALSPLALMMILCLFTLILSTFISHSAVANLLAPLVAGMPAASPVLLTMACALSASTGHALPVSTPPNAIAYSTGEIKLKEMAISGGIASLISALLIGFYLYGIQRLIHW